MIFVVLVELTLEGEHHIIRIEVAGRLEIFCRVPFHPFTQVKGIGFAVFADVPLLSQRRMQFRRADSELHQTVVNLARTGVIGGAGREQLRVKSFRRAF